MACRGIYLECIPSLQVLRNTQARLQHLQARPCLRKKAFTLEWKQLETEMFSLCLSRAALMNCTDPIVQPQLKPNSTKGTLSADCGDKTPVPWLRMLLPGQVDTESRLDFVFDLDQHGSAET